MYSNSDQFPSTILLQERRNSSDPLNNVARLQGSNDLTTELFHAWSEHLIVGEHNSDVTMVYGTNYSIHGVYKPTNITGGAHIVGIYIYNIYRMLVIGMSNKTPAFYEDQKVVIKSYRSVGCF
jgi:hypothetical protein